MIKAIEIPSDAGTMATLTVQNGTLKTERDNGKVIWLTFRDHWGQSHSVGVTKAQSPKWYAGFVAMMQEINK